MSKPFSLKLKIIASIAYFRWDQFFFVAGKCTQGFTDSDETISSVFDYDHLGSGFSFPVNQAFIVNEEATD